MSGRNMRTFVAADLEHGLKRDLEREIGFLQMAGADVRWTAVENMHMTIRFLGDISPEEIVPVVRQIRRAADGVPCARVAIKGVGAFPSLDDPRVIIARVEGDTRPLQTLFANLQESLKTLGFRPEPRPLELHVTLGYVKGDKNIGDLIEKLKTATDRFFGDTVVDHVDLMLSEHKKGSTVYSVMESIDLADADPDDASKDDLEMFEDEDLTLSLDDLAEDEDFEDEPDFADDLAEEIEEEAGALDDDEDDGDPRRRSR